MDRHNRSTLGSIVRRYPVQIVATVIIITICFLPLLPSLSFDTDLNTFTPENETSRADRRVEEYFGESTITHLLLVEAKEGSGTGGGGGGGNGSVPGTNVLSVAAIREQRDLAKAARSIHNVVGVLAIEELVEIVCEGYFGSPIEELPDENVSFAIGMGLRFLDGTIDASLLASENVSEMRVLDLQLFLRTLLPGDYDADARSAGSTLMLVQINGSISTDDISATSLKIQGRVAQMELSTVTVRHTSSAILADEIDAASSKIALEMGAGMFLIVVLVLFIAFRRISYVLIPLATLAIAIIWTLATLMLFGVHMTALMVAVVPLMLGLGIDYSIYISLRYQEELGKAGKARMDGRERNDRVMGRTLDTLLPALVVANVTTIVSFFSNVSSTIVPIRDFGIACAIGIGYCFVLSMLFGPACRVIIDRDRRGLIGKKWEVPVFDKAMAMGTNVVIRYPMAAVAIVVLITAASVFGATKLDRHFGVDDFVPRDARAMVTLEDIDDGFPSASYQEVFVLIEGDGDAGLEDPVAMRSVFDLTDAVMDDAHVLHINISGQDRPIVRSLALVIRDEMERDPGMAGNHSLGPDGRPLSTATVEDMHGLMGRLLERRATDLSDLVLVVRREGSSERVASATVIRIFVDISNDKEARDLYRDMKRDLSAVKGGGLGPIDVTFTGGWILTVVTLDTITESQITSTAAAMVITAIILIVIFRKPVLGAIAMAPVILSTVWVLGTMYLFDIPLNVMTITITSLTVGLGIDYSVYITERFRDERRTHGIRRSMRRTIERTGTAVVLASLTTILGFSLLIMAPLPILRNFGLISASAMAFAFVLGVFMLPLALVVWSFHESGILAGRIKEEVVVRGGRRARAGRAQMRPDVGEEEEGEVDMGEVEEKEEDVEAEETGDVEQAEREGEEQDEDVYDGPIFASQGKASKEKRMRRKVEGPSRTSKGKGRGREGSGSNGS